MYFQTEYQYYYEDYENLSEPPDAGEIEHRDSDSSDFEETYVKKKKRKAKVWNQQIAFFNRMKKFKWNECVCNNWNIEFQISKF